MDKSSVFWMGSNLPRTLGWMEWSSKALFLSCSDVWAAMANQAGGAFWSSVSAAVFMTVIVMGVWSSGRIGSALPVRLLVPAGPPARGVGTPVSPALLMVCGDGLANKF